MKHRFEHSIYLFFKKNRILLAFKDVLQGGPHFLILPEDFVINIDDLFP